MIPITVAIPTYNRPGFLRRALQSVRAQTLSPFEIIITDSASDDTSWRQWPELDDPRVRLICHPTNVGVIRNWNNAIAEARGEAICLLHDDDLMHPRYVEVIAGLLERYPQIGMAISQARRVDSMGAPLGVWSKTAHDGLVSGPEFVLWALRHFGPPALPSAVTYRLSACRALGGFGGSINTSAFDVDFLLRMAMDYDVGFANEVLSDYTMHPHQISEEFWRRKRSEGLADTALEMLAAGCWLLNRDTLADDSRREVAGALAKATAIVARCMRPTRQSVEVF